MSQGVDFGKHFSSARSELSSEKRFALFRDRERVAKVVESRSSRSSGSSRLDSTADHGVADDDHCHTRRLDNAEYCRTAQHEDCRTKLSTEECRPVGESTPSGARKPKFDRDVDPSSKP